MKTCFRLYLQSTYENFRYRYDRSENPYNRGIFGNFMEVFCTSIPPSKNNFRAFVVREPQPPTRATGGSFVNSNIEKVPSDVEMSSMKPGWKNEAMAGDAGGAGGGNGVGRRASLGRSGSWDLQSDIASITGAGYSDRFSRGGSSASLGGSLVDVPVK